MIPPSQLIHNRFRICKRSELKKISTLRDHLGLLDSLSGPVLALTVLSRHVATQLVAPGQPDVLVGGEDHQAVQVAGPDGEVSQARPGHLKRLEI